MDLDAFIKGFANQFDETDISVFNADTAYQDLDEWGSLISMSIIAFVKTECGKTVTGKEIRSCETIRDLFELVSSK